MNLKEDKDGYLGRIGEGKVAYGIITKTQVSGPNTDKQPWGEFYP